MRAGRANEHANALKPSKGERFRDFDRLIERPFVRGLRLEKYTTKWHSEVCLRLYGAARPADIDWMLKAKELVEIGNG
jgi:hypothetical protein